MFNSVIADTTNISHLDQLSVALRYVFPSVLPIEHLVNIKDIDEKKVDGQVTAVPDTLCSKDFNTKSVAFQSYDYTYSMSLKVDCGSLGKL